MDVSWTRELGFMSQECLDASSWRRISCCREKASHAALQSPTGLSITQICLHPLPDLLWPVLYTNPLAVGGGGHIGEKVSWSSAKLGHAFLNWGDFIKKKKSGWTWSFLP